MTLKNDTICRDDTVNRPDHYAARVEDQLCFALYAASRAATAAYRPHLEAMGLTYPRYLVMLALWDKDELSIGDLGERLFLDSGTLSPLLKKLEADRLVKRFSDPDDDRVVKIRLTPHGWSLREAAAQMRSSLSCRLGLPADEANDLRNRVRLLFNQLLRLMEESSESNEGRLHGGSHGNGRTRRKGDIVRQESRRAAFPAERARRQRRARNHQS